MRHRAYILIDTGSFYFESEINMYKGLYEYLEQSPQLQGKRFNFDWIGSQPTNYSVDIPTFVPEIFTDTLGDKKCRLNFYIRSQNQYGEDVLNNIENLDFFLKVKKWFEKQNRMKNFPDLGNDKKVIGVHDTTEGYIVSTTTSTALYQIQCTVEYIQENTNPNKAPLRF